MAKPELATDWGRGFIVEAVACAMCGHEWTTVIPAGALGLECPACGFNDTARYWPNAEPGLYTDGVWTTGRLVMVAVSTRADGMDIEITEVSEGEAWRGGRHERSV